MSQTVIRQRGTIPIDPYSGKPTDMGPNFNDPDELEVHGVWLAPTTAEVVSQAGTQMVKRWRMYCRGFIPDVKRGDRIKTGDGELYRVIEPEIWRGRTLGGAVYDLEVLGG